jgi:integrase
MPIEAFTARWVQTLKPNGQRVEYFDEMLTGLVLRVEPSGRKVWRVAYRANGRWRRMNLASVAVMDLATARDRARELLGDVAGGADPAEDKRTNRDASTFAELAHAYIEKHAKKLKRSWRQDQRMLYGSPQKKRTGKKPHVALVTRWGHRKAKEMTRREIREVLEEIVERAPTMANHILCLVRKMFNWAIEHDWLETNPCSMIKRPAPARQRDRVLSEDEIRAVWKALDEEQPAAAALFKLRLFTAQRGGELHSAAWADMDLATGWWTIPGERAKNGLSHRVPLSPPAVRLLEDLRANHGESPWVFPSKGKAGSHVYHMQKAIERVVKRSDVSFRGHDLRRTAASLMVGAGVPRLVVSKILNHVETGITAVYDRHSYDPEKRAALDFWGTRLEAIVSDQCRAEAPAFSSRAIVVPFESWRARTDLEHGASRLLGNS